MQQTSPHLPPRKPLCHRPLAEEPSVETPSARPWLGWILSAAAALLTLGAAECFLVPGGLVLRDLADPALGGPGIPQRALDLHESLSERIGPWARERIASGDATRIPLDRKSVV